ncbi:hypothetical protein Tco_0059541 [Tanacetum coccineum]
MLNLQEAWSKSSSKSSSWPCMKTVLSSLGEISWEAIPSHLYDEEFKKLGQEEKSMTESCRRKQNIWYSNPARAIKALYIKKPQKLKLILRLLEVQKVAFQRMNDIHKFDIETLLTYLVMASNITTPENTRFCLKLRKLIENYLDQEKLKSKKVKLEFVGYKLD